MGVLDCSRRNCERIMCDTYISSVGYVCNDCKDEFKLYVEKSEAHPTTEREIEKELIKFMETEKDSYSNDNSQQMSIDEYFGQFDR